MKTVLIHSLVFSPDGVSTAYLYNDIAVGLKENGFNVVVLTTTPHYNFGGSIDSGQGFNKKLAGLYYTRDFNGIKAYHIPQKKFQSAFLRLIGFVYWHILSLFIGLFKIRFDYVLSPSPPLTIGLVAVLLGKLKNAKTIYNVQEIYPDLLINQKNLQPGMLIWCLRKLEKFIYRHADAVITIDKEFYNTIVPRFNKKEKLKIIPNFVDAEVYKPEKPYLGFLKNVPFSPNALKIMYAGNIGHAQDWDTLIHVAAKLENQPVEFFIIGDGAKKKGLINSIEQKKLSNIKVLPYQKREMMSGINAFADVHMILMEPIMAGQGFPSKIYTILACGKPLLVSSTKNSPLYHFLKPLNVGFFLDCENKEKLVDDLVIRIKSYLKDDNLLKKHAANARKIILDRYSKKVVVGQYVNLIKEL